MIAVTLNIWQEQGPWRERMDTICRQLGELRADVICLQEVRQRPPQIPQQAATIAQALGMEHVYEIAQPWGGGDEGLAVLSRLPIAERAVQELPFDEGRSRRICLGVALEAGADRPVWVFTTHLAFRLADGELRERQVRAVDAFARKKRRDAHCIVAGDFNAVPDADEIRFMRGLSTLDGQRTYYQDAFRVCHGDAPGPTWCLENPYTEQLHWFPRDRRLDYIFVTPCRRDGSGRVTRCDIVCDRPDDEGTRCSDHYGVLAEIQF